jgi:hypothetical protein
MKPINVEKLMNHSTGISDSYYRATESELLEDYLKAVDLLTINGDKIILQKQVLELKEKSKDSEYIIKAKLDEKDAEVQILKEKFECDIKAMRQEIKEEMKIQIAQMVARLKAEIVKEGLS